MAVTRYHRAMRRLDRILWVWGVPLALAAAAGSYLGSF